MAQEFEIAVFNDHELALPMITKDEMKNNNAFTRGALWKEIKAIRAADPNGDIIPLPSRLVGYVGADALADELITYHDYIKSARANPNPNPNPNPNRNNNENDDDIIMGDEEEQEIDPIVMPLTFQISSPSPWVSSNIISSWFRQGSGNDVPHSFVIGLAQHLQQYFDKYKNAKYSLELECRAYNGIVLKHVATKFNPKSCTLCEYIGNQHKVLKKKAKSIATQAGTVHAIISFNLQRYLRNDAPSECNFRCALLGAPETYKDDENMKVAVKDFQIDIGSFLSKVIDVIKSNSKSRLQIIANSMNDLESRFDEYKNNDSEMEYYKQMDKLRKERSMLLETVEVQDRQPNEEQPNEQQQNEQQQNEQ